jgi:DNA-directed RNA polymerase subunit omega
LPILRLLMARVTVEDCLEKVSNRFALTVLAARRARALSEGRGNALVECDNKDCVTALREIGAGGVRYIEDVDHVVRNYISEQRSSFLRSVDGDHTFIEATSFSLGADDGGAESDVEELRSDLTQLALEVTEDSAKTGEEDETSEEVEAATAGIDPDASDDLEGSVDDDDDDADLLPEGDAPAPEAEVEVEVEAEAEPEPSA